MSVGHETFTLGGEIAASPERASACRSDAEKKRGWSIDGDGPDWETRAHTPDFKVGGTETGASN